MYEGKTPPYFWRWSFKNVCCLFIFLISCFTYEILKREKKHLVCFAALRKIIPLNRLFQDKKIK